MVFLISDNTDTIMGMRLAGIDGGLAQNELQLKEAFNKAIKDKEIAVILITEKSVSFSKDFVYDLKTKIKRPLILEIPDRHGGGRTKEAISSYIRDAIGLKM